MWPFRKNEARANSLENPQVSISDPAITDFLSGGIGWQIAGVSVNPETALGVPAIWSAVNFLAASIAGLPCHLYVKGRDGRKRQNSVLSRILHDAVNDEMTSFEWRKWFFESVLLEGRGLTYIERVGGRVVNLFPMDVRRTQIKRVNGRKRYIYTQDGGKRVEYEAHEVIDVPFMLKGDATHSRSPIVANRESIALMLAAIKYGAKFFKNGGVPPFVVTGNFQSSTALKNAADDLRKAVAKAARENRQALTLPAGLELKSIGVDPSKMQLTDIKKDSVVEAARIYSLPPTFLQDLTNGTFSNTEQQDLHYVKHTLRRWVVNFEQELKLKLFGRGNTRYSVTLNVDGILRGDFKSRMEAFAKGISVGHYQPAETRAMDKLPPADGTDRNFIQGAMVPIERAGEHLDKGITPPKLLKEGEESKDD